MSNPALNQNLPWIILAGIGVLGILAGAVFVAVVPTVVWYGLTIVGVLFLVFKHGGLRLGQVGGKGGSRVLMTLIIAATVVFAILYVPTKVEAIENVNRPPELKLQDVTIAGHLSIQANFGSDDEITFAQPDVRWRDSRVSTFSFAALCGWNLTPETDDVTVEAKLIDRADKTHFYVKTISLGKCLPTGTQEYDTIIGKVEPGSYTLTLTATQPDDGKAVVIGSASFGPYAIEHREA